jgi:hypothetical protein
LIDTPEPRADSPTSAEANGAQPAEDAPAQEGPSFGRELATFVQRIEAFPRTLPLMMAVMQLTEREAAKRCNKFLDDHGTKEREDAESQTFVLQPERQPEYERLKRRLSTARTGRTELPRSYLISLVSHFDAYLGRLIRTMYLVKPEMLNASERTLSLEQIVALGSIAEAKELIVEKEVESVLRESHSEHFRWLEQKLTIPLRKELAVWSSFIEVTERRNLFVHTGGKVSRQYLKVCAEHGVTFTGPHFKAAPSVGDELDVSPAYFMHAYRVLFEIGFKLAHVVWRKMQPDDRSEADGSLIDITYEVLFEEDYVLARTLLDFATSTIKKFSTDDRRRRLVINRAQAYKWAGDDAKAKAIVAEDDWSATGDHFQLAVAVLSDDHRGAADLMRRIGVAKEITKWDYRHWPLFRAFRDTPEFGNAYKDVFQEEFVSDVAKKADLDLLNLMPE